ncbi:hypothetical protein Theam_0803 [Thermovibrio ammonificans HB-1]|uniref:Uncharacterized protein n=1 Tax=Thermovibrio ammonificans (strain DSM 15698 / JCM 12110 / HB-1) TaxID=648996 RepID=E8T6I6_THEA1|nr:hypothetical protein Theam_0803 [Thermovibrio ammonificans HB-1]
MFKYFKRVNLPIGKKGHEREKRRRKRNAKSGRIRITTSNIKVF